MVARTDTGIDTPGESVSINLQPAVIETGRGSMTLDHFIVLGSEASNSPNYIMAAISIDYLSSKARQEIDKNLPLYRDIIYDAIDSALRSEKAANITEEDLLVSIKNALNRALSKKYIVEVTFTSFKTG